MTEAGFPSGPDQDPVTGRLFDYDTARLESELRRLTEAGASALEVARVVLWVIDPARDDLRRIHVYDRSTGEHSTGDQLHRRRSTGYFRALEAGSLVAVGDASREPRWSELSELEGEPSGVSAWIDAPVTDPGGKASLRGLLRFEHLGPARTWTESERSVARGFGVAIGALLEHHQGRVAPPVESGIPEGADPDGRTNGSAECAPGGDQGEPAGATGSPDHLIRKSVAGMAVVTADGAIRSCNPAFARMLGVDDPRQLEGLSFRERCLQGEDWDRIPASVRDRGRVEERELRVERLDGGGIWLLLGVTRLVDGTGAEDLFLVSSMNISNRKSSEERLQRLANRDPLTGVANRRLLQDSAESALALADRQGRKAALLYIDLRRFKQINDQLGHEVGDRVLTHVADRLRARGRDSDLTARIGGDEFAVLLSDVEDGVEGARKAAERLMESFRAPIEVGRRSIEVEATIGMAVYPDHARNISALLRQADEAMYRGKAWGEGRIVVWDEVPETGGGESRGAGERSSDPGGAAEPRELPTGSSRDEAQLELRWQPIQRAADGRIVGMEALLRGRDPRRGLIPARQFLGRAGGVGGIAAFDRWVLAQAVEPLQSWLDAGTVDWIALNVAPESLLSGEYMDDLDELVSQGALAPETVLIQVRIDAREAPVAEVGRAIQSLRERGFGTALDLTDESEEVRNLIIETLDVDVLEVTPELLAAEGTDPRRAFLGDGGRAADRPWLLAKMVESEDDLRRARSAECELIQGRYVGPPVPTAALGASTGGHW